MLSMVAKAVPAFPGKVRTQQPDGTTVTLQLHGDEYLCFTTTADGYTVLKREDGFFVYAQRTADGTMEPTERVAHDAADRTEADLNWLRSVKKMMAPPMSEKAAARRQADHSRQARARAAAQAKAPLFDYSNFRGLIVLVEFSDRKFSRDDYPQMFERMVNEHDYKGYGLLDLGVFTGSVRDYFYDNSYGMFDPHFDIVGPVTVSRSQYYAQGTEKADQLTKDVIDAVDEQVDFSQYDLDNDGAVDMVYFLFAGYGANYDVEGSKLIWPHAGYLLDPQRWRYIFKDGKQLGYYACSTELMGAPGSRAFDGVGTMCHEFGHVLGLPDLYDTDYEKSGGESLTPGNWSIMAAGPYQNNGRTPTGYTLFERYALGFATPEVISGEGSFTLSSVGTSNTGYRLNASTRKELFLIENRQKSDKWDQYLPGHGMLVYRVDSTNVNVWETNEVNCNPSHNYFELLRAGGSKAYEGSASDPFPGTGKVTMLNNVTSPANLLSWAGKPTLLGLDNIAESHGVVTFDVVDVNVLRSITLPDVFTLGLGLSAMLEPMRDPDYAPYTLKWTTSNPQVVTIDARGMMTAHQAGQAVITVVANGDEKLTAQCTVTVNEPASVPQVSDFCALDNDEEMVLMLNDALVVFADDSRTFIRDASGALCLEVDDLGLKAGDLLNGRILGKKVESNGIPMLREAAYGTNSLGFTVSKGHDVVPRRVSVAELTPDDRCDLVTISGTTLERSSGVWCEGGDKRVRVYNLFQVTGLTAAPPAIAGKYFDVTGIYFANKLSGKLIDEIEMTASIVEVEPPSAIHAVVPDDVDAATVATVSTLDGRIVARTTVGRLSQVPLRHGIYVVSTAAGVWRMTR